MAAKGTVAIAGTVTLATYSRETEAGVSQIIEDVEVKSGHEVLIPLGGTSTPVPLSFSTNIDEVLWIHFFAPNKLKLIITTSDPTAGGPIRVGLKGHTILTMYPGEGIKTIQAINPSTTDDVLLSYSYASKQNSADDDPAFWQ